MLAKSGRRGTSQREANEGSTEIDTSLCCGLTRSAAWASARR